MAYLGVENWIFTNFETDELLLLILLTNYDENFWEHSLT